MKDDSSLGMTCVSPPYAPPHGWWAQDAKGEVGTTMGGTGALALLWVARILEAGFKHYPRYPDLPLPTCSSNHTCWCQCDCQCEGTDKALPGVLVGFALGLLALTCCQCIWTSRSSTHEPFQSPRRRGGGVVAMPARADRACLVL